MKLTEIQLNILRAIKRGETLKSHRDLEGVKVFQLHTLNGAITDVNWEAVEALQDAGLIDSNKKFPAATYWLTEVGKTYASE